MKKQAILGLIAWVPVLAVNAQDYVRRREIIVQEQLADRGISSKVKVGDGYAGWPEAALFDAIIVTCAPSHVPPPLQAQLKEGSRMIIPIGESMQQELIFLTKRDGKIIQDRRLPVLFVPMKDAKGKRY